MPKPNDYPKMLYKPGSEIEHEGKSLDTIVVENEKEEAAATKDGYSDLAKAMKAKAD